MIALKDVTFGYLETERPSLTRVTIEFSAGEFALVCGATGSGKSTLLRILNGLAPHFTGGALSGSVIVNGQDVTGLKPHDLAMQVGFVNQQPESSFVTDTVEQELVYGMEQLGFERTRMAESLEQVASLLGLSELLDKPLSWLSGGQQQRVAIAAALAAGQKILLLDEPTSALDPEAAAEIIGVLKSLAHDHGITVILVEHRIERVIELEDITKKYKKLSHSINVQGIKKIVNYFKNKKIKFIFISTCSNYGFLKNKLANEKTRLSPKSIYAKQKVLIEKYLFLLREIIW